MMLSRPLHGRMYRPPTPIFRGALTEKLSLTTLTIEGIIMKARLVIVSLLLAVGLGTSLFAANTPAPALDNSHKIAAGVPHLLARDAADEDSIVYEYGFEDGWGGWTRQDLTDPGLTWHPTETHANQGMSWWVGREDPSGYDDNWLQFLQTPPVNLGGRQNLRLKFMIDWSVENPSLGDPPPEPYDGWDGCNVWISTNNGDTWSVLTPTSPAYYRTSLYSFGEQWGMGANIPGWVASSDSTNWPASRWLSAEFNLDRYANSTVLIRWAFASDPGWHTGEAGDADRLAWGMLVDSLRIISGDNVLWHNDGQEIGDMTRSAGPTSGEFWQITQDDHHEGNASARCPIRGSLVDALVSPAIDVPEVGWYTWFDFWVRADTRMSDANGDNTLDDYYYVEVSNDSIAWQQIIYDYGRDEEWMANFHYYGPDTTFRTDFAEWRRKLNLTQWAGERIWLRWVIKTDTVTDGDQGTGVYIDDVRVLTTHRAQNDVGIEWLRVGFPTTIGMNTACKVNVRNYGLGDQGRVVKYYRINNGPGFAITPWEALPADQQIAYNFTLDQRRLPFADSLTISAYTLNGYDTLTANDVATVPGVVVYPQGIWRLGYDDRTYDRYVNYQAGSGALVRFTPSADGIRGAFDIKAIRVRWNGAQQGDASFRLHVFADNAGNVGNELLNRVVSVTHDDLLPNVMVIDLTDANTLQRLNGNFWCWFEITRQDGFPQIIGAEEKFGRGHYFDYNVGGGIMDTSRSEVMVNPIVMAGGLSPRNTLLSGRGEIAFGAVDGGGANLQRVALFNGGVNPITVTAAQSSDAHFSIVDFQETTLRIGDMMHVYVQFQAADTGSFAGQITFTSSDTTSPVVNVSATSTTGVEIGKNLAPTIFALGEAYPNPFNSRTVIPFNLPSSMNVRVAVYDLTGREVAEILNTHLTAGRHSVTLDAAGIAAGVYVCRLESGSLKATQKLVLIK